MTELRILHILDHSVPLHSGYAFRTGAILAEQRRRGWQTHQITSAKHTASGQALEEQVDGLHFYRTPKPVGWLSGLPVLNQWAVVESLARRLTKVVQQVQPNLLHAHSPALNGLAALRVGRRFQLPVVYELRAFWEDAAVDHGTSSEGGWRYRASRRLETHVLRHADGVATLCEGIRNDVLGRGIPADKVTVVPNAVDVDSFRANPPDPELGRHLGLTDCRILGFIGSFYGYEGLSLLLRALPTIRRRIPNVKLLLVGGGYEEDRLRRLTGELNLTDHIVFTGRVPHDQVQRYYDLVDILIYPRLPMRLTELVTPLKPLEAMAQSKLVIASDVGGHKELIQDGTTGILFKAGSSDDLADKTVSLLSRPGDWPAIQAAGRRFVETQRTWRATVERYRSVYQRVLK